MPVWLQHEDLAAHAAVRYEAATLTLTLTLTLSLALSLTRYEAAVLRLDERHVASQQRRLLAFVSSALGDKVGATAHLDPNPNPNPNRNPNANPNPSPNPSPSPTPAQDMLAFRISLDLA